MVQDAVRDVRYAVRLLFASPAFTIIATVTLSLGIGANTAIFSVVHGLLLRPLPFTQPDRLLFVDSVLASPDGDISFQIAYTDVEAIRIQSKTVAAVAAWSNGRGLALDGTGGARRLEANFVGRGYFSILGVTPIIGREFSPEEHAIGGQAPLVAVLSHATWQQEFGGNPTIIGEEVRLQNRVFTVVGVMPASFTDVAESQGTPVHVWSPIERAPELFPQINLADRASRLMWAVARLTSGVSPEEAKVELATISRQIADAFPATNGNFTLRSASLSSQYFADARQPLWFLLGGSVFVLLIGCANVANLLLVRATDRTREFAVRQAIGGSTARLVRQLLVESVVLALIGSLGGLALASWLTPPLVRWSAIEVPAFTTIGIDGTVLALNFATALACGLLFGLAPIWRAMNTSLRTVIGTTRVTRSSRGARWLVGIEITAAFLLAAGALLMLQSFTEMTRTDLLFRTDHFLTVQLELPQDRYPMPPQRIRAGAQLLEHVRMLPGVEHATIWGPSMFGHSTWVAFLARTDRVTADHERLMVWRHSTNGGALTDLGIGLVSGRDIAHTDTLDTPPVAIVSETTAARLWPGEDPIGRQLRVGAATTPTVTVVGVAADARHRGRFRFSEGAAAFEPQLDIYLPFAQRPNALVTLGIRTSGAPENLAKAVRAAIAAFDPLLPVYDVESLDSRMRTEEAPLAFAALLLNLYGALAIALAAIGVYGVLSAAVAGRSRELGIRTALGADPRRLVRTIVGEGLMVSTIAVAAGAIVAWAMTRSFGGLLFGVTGNTTVTLVAAAAILIAMAAAASLLPARRAARVDPVAALRNE